MHHEMEMDVLDFLIDRVLGRVGSGRRSVNGSRGAWREKTFISPLLS
jgi:hypothetical protein